MSLDSGPFSANVAAAAPLQYASWHELRVKADPLSWSDRTTHSTEADVLPSNQFGSADKTPPTIGRSWLAFFVLFISLLTC
jgi:hypothetical protein